MTDNSNNRAKRPALRPRFKWDLEWRTTLATALLLPVLLWLGNWQLGRADEKTELAQQWLERQQAGPKALVGVVKADSELELAYLPVKAQGRFLPEYLLLDNRIQQGQYGFEVLQYFQLRDSETLVVVNRGWIKGDVSRRSLPTVPEVGSVSAIKGSVYVPPDKPYLLAEQTLSPEWPKVIQAEESDLFVQAHSAKSVFPYSIRLSQESPGALVAFWPVVNVSPEKHQGYAVQWFSMATALLIIFIFRSSNLWQVLRPKTEEHEEVA